MLKKSFLSKALTLTHNLTYVVTLQNKVDFLLVLMLLLNQQRNVFIVRIVGSGALLSTIWLVRIIENNNIDANFRSG